MKPPLLLLHGLNGSGPEMAPLARLLEPHFMLHVPNLLGHGGRPVPDGYTLEEMAADLLDQWTAPRPAHLLGYSVGAYLALYLARHHPEHVRSVGAIAVKHRFDPASVDYLTHLAAPERLGRPGNPRKAEMIAAHGEANWEQVTRNTATLFRRFGERVPLPDDDLRAIRAPVLLLVGDRDPLSPAADSRALAALLPNARSAIFPGPAHPLATLPAHSVVRAYLAFIEEVEHGRFQPGGTVDLAPALVAGGLREGDIRVTLGRARGG